MHFLAGIKGENVIILCYEDEKKTSAAVSFVGIDVFINSPTQEELYSNLEKIFILNQLGITRKKTTYNGIVMKKKHGNKELCLFSYKRMIKMHIHINEDIIKKYSMYKSNSLSFIPSDYIEILVCGKFR